MKQICRHYQAPYPVFAPWLLTRGGARRHMTKLTGAILQREGKRLLIVKDGSHARNFDRIERLYADVPPRYILLFRDVRGVVDSFKRTLNRKLERGFRVWKEATQAMIQCQRVVGPERCFALRYEDLVSDPASAVAGLVEFLGHEFEPEMLNYGQFQHTDHQLALWPDDRYVASVNQGVVLQDALPRWRDDAELLAAYGAQPEIRALNEQLGYRSDPRFEDMSSCCPLKTQPEVIPRKQPLPVCT